MTSLFPAGQSYEIRMLDNRKIGELPEINGKLVKVSTVHLWHFLCCFPDPPPHVPPLLFSPPGHRAGVSLGGAHDALLFPPPFPQSIFRVVFHDRRLQYTEHQQLEGWRWNRPGDRILDIGGVPRGDGGGLEHPWALRDSSVTDVQACVPWESLASPDKRHSSVSVQISPCPWASLTPEPIPLSSTPWSFCGTLRRGHLCSSRYCREGELLVQGPRRAAGSF